MTRLLNQGVRVVVVTGLRAEPACGEPPYFSAAEWLSGLKAAVSKQPDSDQHAVMQHLHHYLYDPDGHGTVYPAESGLRVLADPNKPDYETKMPLFRAAMADFLDQATWKRLDQLTVKPYGVVEPHTAESPKKQTVTSSFITSRL